MKPLISSKEAQIPKELIKSIQNNDCLVFVGAGLSRKCGFPSWQELIKVLIERIVDTQLINIGASKTNLIKKAQTQPAWVAEILRNESESLYFEILRELFVDYEPKDLSIAHTLLSIIPFAGYITTNYDHVLEDYIGIFDINSPLVLTPFERISTIPFSISDRRLILKTHGCASKNINNIVLTSADYFNLLKDIKYERLISNIFQKFTILTVGFSLTDSDFRRFIEERNYIYGKHCPPIFAVAPEQDITQLEKNAFKVIHNLHVFPISSENNYEQLEEFLLSLYCLVYSVDSGNSSKQFESILKYRMSGSTFISYEENETLSHDSLETLKLLSIFVEPIDIDEFTAVCSDFGIDITPAKIRLLASMSPNNKVVTKKRYKPESKHLKFVSEWIGSQIDSIPLNSFPRHLTRYYKSTIENYSGTIIHLLERKESWLGFFGGEKYIERYYRFSEFFKQSGRWRKWMILLENSADLNLKSDLKNEILQDLLWLYFWTRHYDKATHLLEKNPDIVDTKKRSQYIGRIKYMNVDHLKEYIHEHEKQTQMDYFTQSMLGRAYARIAKRTIDKNERFKLYDKALIFLNEALANAKKSYDLIEISVQNWYVACVLADVGKIDEANLHLSETRRLDECIMNRVPGIAWLKVAEYVIAINNDKLSKEDKDYFKNEAIAVMTDLGIKDPETFVKEDYYF